MKVRLRRRFKEHGGAGRGGHDLWNMSEPLRIDRKTGGWFCDQYVCDRADNDGGRSHCKTIKDKENEKISLSSAAAGISPRAQFINCTRAVIRFW